MSYPTDTHAAPSGVNPATGVPQLPNQDPTHDDPRVQSAQERQLERGQNIEQVVYMDTFAFNYTEIFEIPGSGGQTITYKKLTEGDKATYQSITNNDIRVNRQTGDSRFRMDQAKERHTLIELSIVDWTLMWRQPNPNTGVPEWTMVPLNTANIRRWLQATDPAIVQALEKKLRDFNPWMKPDEAEDLEAIDARIEELRIQREKVVEKMAEKS